MSGARIDRRRVANENVQKIAARQHGVITREQLLAAGLTPGMVARSVRALQLRAIHRGVYQIGPLTPPRAPLMAAVLACGAAAAVSHRSGAGLWELPTRKALPAVDVTVWGADHRRPGIHVHRVTTIGPDEVTRRDGIPVTTVARTLLDLAGTTPRRELERVLEEALAKRLTSRAALITLLRRYPRRAGVGRLRAVLDSANPTVTRSEAERQLLELIRRARLPTPETNVVVAGHEVDFFWRNERLVAEVDGFAFHSGASKFEWDRERDAELVAAGVRVVRVTWHQLVNESDALLVRLTLALARTVQA